MKKFILFLIYTLLTIPVFAQPIFDIGLKGGANFSKVSLDLENYSSESVVKTHFGAFGRFGFGRIYVQPEIYFSGKGGDLNSSLTSVVTSFDFSTVDIPILLGVKIVKGKKCDLHAVAGPVYSNITKQEVSGDELFNKDFYNNHYFGIQYGLGFDVLFIAVDARMENAFDDFYSQAGKGGKSSTFMLSLGFKFL